MQELVEKTWQELGYRIRSVGYKIWVRTLPHRRRSPGGLWLSPRQASFYGELPHLVTVEAVVLSTGPRGLATAVKPGDVIAFSRVHFARHVQLQPTEIDAYGTSEEFVGYVDANQIFGFVEESLHVHRREAAQEYASAAV